MGALEDFADLHKGGFIANVAKGVKPLTRQGDYVEAYGEEYGEMIKRHIEGDANIGVYPLWQKNGVWMVNWGAVDLDEGDISDIHANNLQTLLTKMGITSWKEPSKSKGFHVWVYLQAPMAASLVRQALIGVLGERLNRELSSLALPRRSNTWPPRSRRILLGEVHQGSGSFQDTYGDDAKAAAASCGD